VIRTRFDRDQGARGIREKSEEVPRQAASRETETPPRVDQRGVHFEGLAQHYPDDVAMSTVSGPSGL
jgi:hypothetical protein